jgi:predicted GIY-YIG superfamily endonuclease
MAKRAQLVSQHLENISHEALSKYQDVIRSYVRGHQGIYALYRKNELYYVGLAGNLRSRLKSHLRDRHKKLWDRFSVYLTIGDSHLKDGISNSKNSQTKRKPSIWQVHKIGKSQRKTFSRSSSTAEARN